MRASTIACTVAVAVLLTIAAPRAEAEVPGPSCASFSGVWTYAGKPDEGKRRRAAIEAATKDLSFFIRGTARGRLEERTAPPDRLTIAIEGDRLAISNGRDELSLRFDAEPVTREKNGRKGKLSARCEGGRIVVVTEGKKGRREATYTLSPDGRQLTLSARMAGERLSAPLDYESTYRPENTKENPR